MYNTASGRDKTAGTVQPHDGNQYGKRKDLWCVGGSQEYLHVWLCGGMVQREWKDSGV